MWLDEKSGPPCVEPKFDGDVHDRTDLGRRHWGQCHAKRTNQVGISKNSSTQMDAYLKYILPEGQSGPDWKSQQIRFEAYLEFLRFRMGFLQER